MPAAGTGSNYGPESYIPTYEELTVPEIEVTAGVLRAAALYMGQYCDNESKEFMLCKNESNGSMNRCVNEGREEFMLCKNESNGSMNRCVNEGREVTRCGMKYMRALKQNCYEEFTKYWQCVDKAPDMRFDFCRKSQEIFDKCSEEKMNIKRPELGYFSKIRLHDTTRPKPTPPELNMPDRIEPLQPIEGKSNLKPKRNGFIG